MTGREQQEEGCCLPQKKEPEMFSKSCIESTHGSWKGVV